MPNEDFRHDLDPKKMPTLLGLRDVLRGYGLRVGSIVCPGIKYKMPQRRPGIMVLMLDEKMIAHFGPFLAEQVAKMNGKQNAKARLVIDPLCPVSEYFVEMERVGLFFGWMKHEETRMLVALFSGDPDDGGLITPLFCERLTKLGCTTSLT